MEGVEDRTMARQTLKDKSGHVLGYIDDKESEQVGFDSKGHRVGRYYKKTNKTYDSAGHVVGTGNLLAHLIFSRD
jgi:hypothetical protein